MKRLKAQRVLAASLALAATLSAPLTVIYAKEATQKTSKKPVAPRPAGRIPADLVGSWTWGSVNPGRYVDKKTGDYVGHTGGGAISYTFGKDGSHQRHVLIDLGAGFDNETVFSAMEGTAAFDETAGVIKVRLTKGTVTFKKRSGTTKRKLTQEDMERGGSEFPYRLEKDEKGRPYLLVGDKGKPVEDGRRFYKDVEREK